MLIWVHPQNRFLHEKSQLFLDYNFDFTQGSVRTVIADLFVLWEKKNIPWAISLFIDQSHKRYRGKKWNDSLIGELLWKVAKRFPTFESTATNCLDDERLVRFIMQQKRNQLIFLWGWTNQCLQSAIQKASRKFKADLFVVDEASAATTLKNHADGLRKIKEVATIITVDEAKEMMS